MKFFNLIFVISLTSCASPDDDVAIPLPIGEYSVLGPYCVSTQQSPVYPSAEKALALFDFNGVISHKLYRHRYLTKPFVLEEIQTKSCKLSIKKSPLIPIEGYFATSIIKEFEWEPENCQLEISTVSGTFFINQNSSEIFDQTNSPEADILYEVSFDKGQYILRSADGEPYNSVWLNFGCADSDQIQYNLKPI